MMATAVYDLQQLQRCQNINSSHSSNSREVDSRKKNYSKRKVDYITRYKSNISGRQQHRPQEPLETPLNRRDVNNSRNVNNCMETNNSRDIRSIGYTSNRRDVQGWREQQRL
jgi:hypothetical protein